MNMETRLCKICKSPLFGRSDKVFCSVKCKTTYHEKLAAVTLEASSRIDKILHRNRSILLEVMGKQTARKKIRRQVLDQKKFNWTYMTHYHLNSQNKMVHYVYDFSWTVFSDQEVLIKRLR